LNHDIVEAQKIEEDVLKKAEERGKHEDLDKDPRLKFLETNTITI